MSETWRLYKRLFLRSLLMGGLVFGALHLVEVLFRDHGAGGALVTVVLTLSGTALLQGGLVEIVRGLHSDGDDEASVGEALGRASGSMLRLVRVSLLYGLGTGLASLLLIVPGLVLATRWAVAVPVAMLEGLNARDSLRRSREIVAGNGWPVFKVMLRVGLIVVAVTLLFGIAAGTSGPLGWWIAATVASALGTPYAAHAFTVVYYELVQPHRPVVLERGRRWESIWDAEDARG